MLRHQIITKYKETFEYLNFVRVAWVVVKGQCCDSLINNSIAGFGVDFILVIHGVYDA